MTSDNSTDTRLANGDTFPELTATATDESTISLPGDLAGSWGIVLFYRGNWCPFCQTQLADFQKQLTQFEAAGVKVVAVSVDSQEQANETVEKNNLTFPVGYGIDPAAVAASHGNYLSDGSDGKSIYSQATGFVLAPDGSIAVALYSSSAIGRLNAPDTLGLIKYAQADH